MLPTGGNLCCLSHVKGLIADINAFQSTPVGTPESDAIGARMVEAMRRS